MTLKKVLPFIFIIIILTALFGPFVSREAFANNESLFSWKNPMFGFINPDYFSASDKIPQITAVITYYVIWTPANLFLAIGGRALDTSISLTINSGIFSDLANEKNGVVSAGWGLSRDIVNIFLIFILLYIAIATILQLSGYGAKQLLVTLIIIAFLVNFSAVITKLIIDASNVLAMGFYNSFEKGADGQIEISKTFKNAFNLENIVRQVDAVKESKDVKNLYLVQFLGYLLGAGIAAIAGFIFFVFALLFLIRMIVLLILLILAPLAFGAMVLPSTKTHAKKWWDALFHQAFFAPAALFMLWMSAKMATSMNSLFKKYLGLPDNKGITDMLIDAQNKTNWDNLAKFVIQFVIIAIMLIASIVVAKQMGAIGADAAQKGVSKGLRKAQGYAGRISRRVAGLGAEGLLTTEMPGLRHIRNIPLVGRGLAGVSALREKQLQAKERELEKSYGTYSTAGLETLKKSPLTTERRRKVIEKVLAKRGPKTTSERIIEMLKAEAKKEVKEETKAEKPISPPPSKPV